MFSAYLSFGRFGRLISERSFMYVFVNAVPVSLRTGVDCYR